MASLTLSFLCSASIAQAAVLTQVQANPTISRLSPSTVQNGTTVYLYGTNFDQNTFVAIDGTYGLAITPTLISSTELSFVIPNTYTAGTTHTVQVGEKGGGVSLSNTLVFTVTNAVSMNLSSSAINSGDSVHIQFTFPSNAVQAILYMTCPASVNTGTTNQCNQNIDLTSDRDYTTPFYNTSNQVQQVYLNYRVATPNGTSLLWSGAQATLIVHPAQAPTIDYINAHSGVPGSFAEMWGYNFTAGNTNSLINAATGSVLESNLSPISSGAYSWQAMMFTIPQLPAGTYNIAVRNANGTSNSVPLTVTGTSILFSASPTNGSEPLSVNFSASNLTAGSSYIISYGDGSNSGPLTAVDVCANMGTNTNSTPCPRIAATHIYTAVGTFTATLSPYVACLYSNPTCMIATQVLGSVTVTVTDKNTLFSATPTTGSVPLFVSFNSSIGGTINYGDGTSGTMVYNNATYGSSHVYQSAGTYTATLTPACSGTGCMSLVPQKVVITVTGSQTSSLYFTIDSSSPPYRIVAAGSTNVNLGTERFTATGDGINLTQITLVRLNGNPGDITALHFYQGSTFVGSAVFIGNSSTTTSTFVNPVFISPNSSVPITITADLAPVGVGQSGTEGDLAAVGITSAKGIDITTGANLNGYGSSGTYGIRIYKSYPTVMPLPLASSNIAPGSNMFLLRFSVTANSTGNVSLNQLAFRASFSGINSLPNVELNAYDANGSLIEEVGPPTAAVNGGTIVFTPFDRDSIVIPAGTTDTFILSGTIPQGLTSITTTLLGDANYSPLATVVANTGSNFIWSPNSTTTPSITTPDWTNANAIPGLPANGISQMLTVTAYQGPSLAPQSDIAGVVGARIVITGKEFSSSYNNVYFGSTMVGQNIPAVPSTSAGYQDIIFALPHIQPGLYEVTVQDANGTAGPNDSNGNLVTYTVTTYPTITAVSPNPISVGAALNIAGSGFNPHLVNIDVRSPTNTNQIFLTYGATPMNNGTQVSLPTSTLLPGTYLIDVRNVGAGAPFGGTASNVMAVIVNAPKKTGTITALNSNEVIGTATNTVNIVDTITNASGTVVHSGTVSVNAKGTWSDTISPVLQPGTYTISVVSGDGVTLVIQPFTIGLPPVQGAAAAWTSQNPLSEFEQWLSGIFQW